MTTTKKTRPTITTTLVRAADLVPGDAALVHGRWTEVLGAFSTTEKMLDWCGVTAENAHDAADTLIYGGTSARSSYPGAYSTALAILDALGTEDVTTAVKYVDRSRSTRGELATIIETFGYYDLFEVQVVCDQA